jgi:hypothetical protein
MLIAVAALRTAQARSGGMVLARRVTVGYGSENESRAA